MTHSDTRYAKGPEGRIAYQVVGDGALDLVFVPGWTSNLDVMWEEASLARFLNPNATINQAASAS